MRRTPGASKTSYSGSIVTSRVDDSTGSAYKREEKVVGGKNRPQDQSLKKFSHVT